MPVDRMPDRYISIHPMTLRLETTPGCDIYIQKGDDSYGLFHPAGEEYTPEVHGRIFNDSIQALYIDAGQTTVYNQYLEQHLDIVLDDPFVDDASRAEIAHTYITDMAYAVFAEPTAELVARYRWGIGMIARYMLENEDAIPSLIARTQSSFLDHVHLVNVGIYGMGLAIDTLSGPGGHDMIEIAAGFFLHDIGRYDISRDILGKEGPLTPDEWDIVRRHPQTGFELLKSFNQLTDELKIIVLQHHERHDGKGYPHGLTGDRIHTYSKICTIADVFDALTSHRPYRPAHSSFEALKIMHDEMKNEFDPDVFSRFVLLFSQNKKMTINRAAYKTHRTT